MEAVTATIATIEAYDKDIIEIPLITATLVWLESTGGGPRPRESVSPHTGQDRTRHDLK